MMAIPLLVAVVLIFILGLARLGGLRRPRVMPWGLLLVWTVLFFGGLSLWLVAYHSR